jgi:hypothetical protein
MDTGRPRHYDNEDDLRSAIESYFGSCEKKTITGLAYHLGFESRQSFYDYEKNALFSYVIKRARLRIEMNYEQMLHSSAPAGAIFALKNFGWSDKTELTGGLDIDIGKKPSWFDAAGIETK